MKIHKLSIVLVALLLCHTYALAQNKRATHDSLLTIYKSLPEDTLKTRILHQLYKSISYSDFDLAKRYALEQIALSKNIGDPKGEGSGYLNLSHYYQTTAQDDSALYYLEKAAPIFKKSANFKELTSLNRRLAITEYSKGNTQRALELVEQNETYYDQYQDSTSLARDYNLKSSILKDLGNREKALEEGIKAYDIYKLLNDELGMADALLALSNLEAEDEHHQQAITYLKEALPLYKKNNDLVYESLTLINMATHALHLERYQEGETYALEALPLIEKVNTPPTKILVYDILGQLNYKMENYNKSIAYYNAALDVKDKTVRPDLRAKVKYHKARMFIAQGQYKKAIGLLDDSIAIYKENGMIKASANAYEARSQAYKNDNNYRLALSDYEQYKVLNDSLYSVAKNKEVEKLRALFDTERKTQQILQQQTEIKVLETQKQVDQLQKTGLLLGVLGLIIILGLAFFSFREKQKRAIAERETLNAELKSRQKTLTTYALTMAKKNEVLEGLRAQAQTLKEKEENKKGYQDIIRTINFDLQDDTAWEDFSKYFEQVHGGFYELMKSKSPDITVKELRLLALLKMNLSSKEMANVLNISPEGVKKARYRLRKKLQISSESSLSNFVMSA